MMAEKGNGRQLSFATFIDLTPEKSALEKNTIEFNRIQLDGLSLELSALETCLRAGY